MPKQTETDPIKQNELRGKILHWLANGETGLSSKTIAFATAGISAARHRHPNDLYDFNRCLNLRNEIPETEEGLNRLAETCAQCRALRDHWQQLEQTGKYSEFRDLLQEIGARAGKAPYPWQG